VTWPKSVPLRICDDGVPFAYVQVMVRGCPRRPAPAEKDGMAKASWRAMEAVAAEVQFAAVTATETLTVSPPPRAMVTWSVPAPPENSPPSIDQAYDAPGTGVTAATAVPKRQPLAGSISGIVWGHAASVASPGEKRRSPRRTAGSTTDIGPAEDYHRSGRKQRARRLW
jgi:hypothetical protein